jgi:hypothetical protein
MPTRNPKTEIIHQINCLTNELSKLNQKAATINTQYWMDLSKEKNDVYQEDFDTKQIEEALRDIQMIQNSMGYFLYELIVTLPKRPKKFDGQQQAKKFLYLMAGAGAGIEANYPQQLSFPFQPPRIAGNPEAGIQTNHLSVVRQPQQLSYPFQPPRIAGNPEFNEDEMDICNGMMNTKL